MQLRRSGSSCSRQRDGPERADNPMRRSVVLVRRASVRFRRQRHFPAVITHEIQRQMPRHAVHPATR